MRKEKENIYRGEDMKTVTVDADALRELLDALVGPHYLMSELRVTQGTGDNPIDRLIEQYNEAVVNHVAMEKQK